MMNAAVMNAVFVAAIEGYRVFRELSRRLSSSVCCGLASGRSQRLWMLIAGSSSDGALAAVPVPDKPKRHGSWAQELDAGQSRPRLPFLSNRSDARFTRGL